MAEPVTIKICGIKTRDILEAAITGGADMVGFVHFARSPRHLDIDGVAELISAARGRVETCVLLVNPDNSTVMEIASLSPDWLQLHGPESPHRVEAIRQESGLAVMKALPIGGPEDVKAIAAYVDVADRLLLDAKPPKGADRPGGLGASFDWSLLKALDPAIGFMLSGGLTPDNVEAAIRAARPMGVDVSSGIESAPGVKDAKLIAAFIAAARQADRALSA